MLLKQRHDELPKLIEVCRQYRQFEQETLQRVVEARSKVQQARETQNITALGQAEGMLRAGLGQIYAVAEAYPDLKTNDNFMQLQQRISSIEGSIADLRELYTRWSISITSASSNFPIRSSRECLVLKRERCYVSQRKKPRMLISRHYSINR